MQCSINWAIRFAQFRYFNFIISRVYCIAAKFTTQFALYVHSEVFTVGREGGRWGQLLSNFFQKTWATFWKFLIVLKKNILSFLITLGIGNCALGSHCLEVTRAKHGSESSVFPMPNCQTFIELDILGLQPCDMVALLLVNTINIISRNLHENGVYFPEDRNSFVLDH